jgi:hypothetical protein
MTNNKHDNSLSLVDAVETLSNIADMDLDKEIGIAKIHSLMVQNEKFSYRTIHWLHKNNTDDTIGFVKEVFKVVLNYLKNFYKTDYTLVTDSKTLDGIKTIMVLVGEAAKKIDKYTQLFHEKHISSVTELKEYKQLQDFYLRKISRTIDEGVLGKWILALSQKAWRHKKIKLEAPQSLATKHAFVDFESVKKDSEYELFTIRKEDGSRFFNSRIIRNIKLICDFGSYFGQEKDPLTDIEIWRDRQAERSAQCILKSIQTELVDFYQDSALKDLELANYVNKVVMALMLAANSQNLISNQAVKNCFEYFKDFQLFLRQALNSQAYQKSFSNQLGSLINKICESLYVDNNSLQDLKAYINYILEEAHELQSEEHLEAARKSGMLWSKLASDYSAMQKLFKNHPSGPLNNILKTLETDTFSQFDPYIQSNCPNASYTIELGDQKFLNLRLPCPTKQEFIQKADIIPEFKGFLRSRNQAKHLLFNLQDRTSWKEYARSQALENLNSKEIVVVTLAKDTDFYHQLAPYHEDHQTASFFSHLNEQLLQELSGFYFPEEVRNAIDDKWIDGIVKNVHKVFFNSKNVLSKEARLEFIELVYLFIELKVIDIVMPESFSFTCKDSIDAGPMASAELYCLLNVFSENALSNEDYQKLNVLIYGPSIINRERIPIQEKFNRFLNLIKNIELAKEDLASPGKLKEIFAPFFQNNWFSSELVLA